MILETAMGVELGVQHTRESNYSNSIQRIVHIFQLRQILPWYQVKYFETIITIYNITLNDLIST